MTSRRLAGSIVIDSCPCQKDIVNKGNCYVQHLGTGRRTRITEKNGTFEVVFWVLKVKDQQNERRSTSFQWQDQDVDCRLRQGDERVKLQRGSNPHHTSL